MSDILVYAMPFEIQKNQWGYKWIGVCNGERVTVILNPYEQEVSFNEIKKEYLFVREEQREVLPVEIQRLLSCNPLPNRYFVLNKEGKNISIEVVISLIEKGYDIKNISMEPYLQYVARQRNDKSYLCQYIDNQTNEVIATILNDKSVVWGR